VADVGSGTGILSEIFLKDGNIVFGIEPNEDMRRMAEHSLSEYPNFKSINGTAESMGIPDTSVDFF
jgi:ubiquinone/menaquinone biosynthesis C-methylase UbiE